MNREEQQLIEDLFARLRNYGGAAGKDPEAEALIRDLIRRSPDAPYYLAQTVIVQQQALERAEARMRQLEDAASQSQQYGAGRGGSFLPGTSVPVSGGRLGGGAQYAPQRSPEAPAPQSSPWSSPSGGGSGGFLASALSTAAGVAGGVFLADGIRSLFGGSSASAWGSGGGDQKTIDRLQDDAQDARDDADQARKDLAADDAELDRLQDAADDSGGSWDDDSSLDI